MISESEVFAVVSESEPLALGPGLLLLLQCHLGLRLPIVMTMTVTDILRKSILQRVH
jgi:hypothetical protein